MVGIKQKLEKDEAEKFEMQKARKQDELKHKKKRRIIKSPTQLPLPNSPDYTPEKTNSIKNNELSPSMSKNLQEDRLKKRKKLSHHPLNHQFPTHLTLPLLQ